MFKKLNMFHLVLLIYYLFITYLTNIVQLGLFFPPQNWRAKVDSSYFQLVSRVDLFYILAFHRFLPLGEVSQSFALHAWQRAVDTASTK